MNCSFRIGRLGGVEFSAHWSFVLLFGGLALMSTVARGMVGSALGVLIGFAIFSSVLTRETGRSIVIVSCGSRALAVTLLPVGGIARLDQSLNDARYELRAAIAGPCTNLGIAAALIATKAVFDFGPFQDLAEASGLFLDNLAWANVGLAALNLLPVSPFDGGRALRSILAGRLDSREAAEFTIALGKAAAIAIGMLGLVVNWVFVLVAIFVYCGADLEAHLLADGSASLENADAGSVMVTQFHVLSGDDTLQKAANEWRTSLQSDFPIVDHGKLVGVLACGRLAEAMARTGPKERVGNVMEREWPVVKDTDPLDAALQKLQSDRCSSVPVIHDGRLVGLITTQSVAKWLDPHRPSERFATPQVLAQSMQLPGRPQQDW